MNFSKEDLQQIEKKGLTPEKVQQQLEIFKRGNKAVNIKAAATVGAGIQLLTDHHQKEYSAFYDENKTNLDIIKFVPASGAATRMFKDLHEFLKKFDPQKNSIQAYLEKKDNKKLTLFFSEIENLPFYSEAVNHARKDHPGFDDLSPDAKKYELVQTILFSPGLNLSNYPKGLVPFHNYGSYVATAFEEHLYEAALYAEVNGVVKLHFTVAQGMKEKFEIEYEEIKNRVEQKTGVKFRVEYSYQNAKTDTIAANSDNETFKTGDGKLFFRPGGHGALIDNLNDLSADLVFVKNIDNVVVQSEVEEVANYKRILGGKLLKLQQECFRYLKELDSAEASAEMNGEIIDFLQTNFFLGLKKDFLQLSEEEKQRYLKEKLDRPLRVCGMVKNEGEPGGGPFLVTEENGENSLQIIESAQIDQKNPQQKEIAQNATHFNPVDIVCGLKNYRGETFDLHKFVDPSTSFIAEKTKEGKPLRALELPGLWNGAMAKWNTAFVEVPVSTFNPVKTVADLLKPSHQVK